MAKRDSLPSSDVQSSINTAAGRLTVTRLQRSPGEWHVVLAGREICVLCEEDIHDNYDDFMNDESDDFGRADNIGPEFSYEPMSSLETLSAGTPGPRLKCKWEIDPVNHPHVELAREMIRRLLLVGEIHES